MRIVGELHSYDTTFDRIARALMKPQIPESTSDYIFISDAQNEIGRAMFGSQWSGDEPTTELPPILPTRIPNGMNRLLDFAIEDKTTAIARFATPIDTATTEYAYRLLCTHHSELRPPTYFFGALAPSLPGQERSFTVKQWEAIEVSWQKHQSDARDAIDRNLKVTKKIKLLVVENVLKCVLRKVEGGPFSEPLEGWSWNTENIQERFHSYRMNPTNFFAPCNSDSRWIFFTKKSVEQAKWQIETPDQRPSERSDGPAYLPEYMQCALAVMQGEKITEANQPTIEYLIAAIPRYWKHPTKLSGTAKKMIAKMVRSMESKSGVRNRMRRT
jgi:hypothetical protein